ncbi:MAG: hypothetical protein SFW35_13435 [Chitinophagales bacterium]|nr:hypothetical protein [Chitinophagales bacterium]
MSILRLGVYIDEVEDVFREIEVKGEQKFIDLHEAISKSFQFKKKAQASFFVSNSRWQKLNEITLGHPSVFDKALNGLEISIESILPGTAKHLVYFNDEFSEYSFLIQIENPNVKEDGKKTYPAVVAAKGKLSQGFGGNIFTEDLGLNEDDLSAESGFGEEGE